ncbi:MAG: 8-amino-7-oxononanoate synthase [Parachlamydia sp.]|nr:MAG: 8-amino-7-oxononanoate synthase [Parachlamydia sp.]
MLPSLEKKLAKRKAQHHFRELSLKPNLIDLASNDYLGLARSPVLRQFILNELQDIPSSLNGFGSTGSRLLTGNSLYCLDLEAHIASFHGYQAGTLFNCGYMANIGLFAAIAGENDCILYDAHIHASMHDGFRLSPAQAFPFRHNDLDHLERRLKRRREIKGECFICLESLYSTDGSQAPLNEIIALSQRYQAHLIVDEAHAIGTCGPNGKGLIAENHATQAIFATLMTFGKALGVHGAIVLGSTQLKETLANFARSLIYTTALPRVSLAAIKSSYAVFPTLDQARQQLQHLIRCYQRQTPQAAPAHIQSIRVPGNHNVQSLSRQLALKGFDVRPLMSPTVRRGEERLRICLHAYNTPAEITELFYKIGAVYA